MRTTEKCWAFTQGSKGASTMDRVQAIFAKRAIHAMVCSCLEPQKSLEELTCRYIPIQLIYHAKGWDKQEVCTVFDHARVP